MATFRLQLSYKGESLNGTGLSYEGNANKKLSAAEKASIRAAALQHIQTKLAALPKEKRPEDPAATAQSLLSRAKIFGAPDYDGTSTVNSLKVNEEAKKEAAKEDTKKEAKEESQESTAGDKPAAAGAAKTRPAKAKPAAKAAAAKASDETEEVGDYDTGQDVKTAKVVIPGGTYTFKKTKTVNGVKVPDNDESGKQKTGTGRRPAKTIEFDVKSNNVAGISEEDAEQVIDYIDSHEDKFKGIKDESKVTVNVEGEETNLDRLRRIAKGELPGTEKPEDIKAAEESLVDSMTNNSLITDAKREARRNKRKVRNINALLEQLKLMLASGGSPDILLNKAFNLVALAAQESAADASLNLIENQQKINEKQDGLIEELEKLGKADKPNYSAMQVINTKMSRNTQDRQSAMSVWRDLNETLKELRQAAQSIDNDTFRTRGSYARFA